MLSYSIICENMFYKPLRLHEGSSLYISQSMHYSVKCDFYTSVNGWGVVEFVDDKQLMSLEWYSGKLWFGVSTKSRGKQSRFSLTIQAFFHTRWLFAWLCTLKIQDVDWCMLEWVLWSVIHYWRHIQLKPYTAVIWPYNYGKLLYCCIYTHTEQTGFHHTFAWGCYKSHRIKASESV